MVGAARNYIYVSRVNDRADDRSAQRSQNDGWPGSESTAQSRAER
jgi:hypothetical protein